MHKKIGYTAGVYDLFHIGHLRLLKCARSQCDELIVAVTSDEYTYRRKGKYPIIPYHERSEIIASVRYVDRVTVQDIDSLDDLVGYMLALQKELGFEVVFKGMEWKGNEKWIRLEQEFKKVGVEVVFCDTMMTSSTVIRQKLSDY